MNVQLNNVLICQNIVLIRYCNLISEGNIVPFTSIGMPMMHVMRCHGLFADRRLHRFMVDTTWKEKCLRPVAWAVGGDVRGMWMDGAHGVGTRGRKMRLPVTFTSLTSLRLMLSDGQTNGINFIQFVCPSLSRLPNSS